MGQTLIHRKHHNMLLIIKLSVLAKLLLLGLSAFGSVQPKELFIIEIGQTKCVAKVYGLQGANIHDTLKVDDLYRFEVKFSEQPPANALGVEGCRNAVLMRFDAQMPDHNHGMLVTPKIEKKEVAERVIWEIAGVMFHMRGSWQLDFVWKIGDREEKSSILLNI